MVKITGAKAHSARLKRIRGPVMIREVGKAVKAAAEFLEVEAELSITTGGAFGNGHVVSQPGEPPNADTGNLDRNIDSVMTGPLTAEVSSNATYSADLEFGNSKVEARPFMAPAAVKATPKAQALVHLAVKRVVGGGTL